MEIMVNLILGAVRSSSLPLVRALVLLSGLITGIAGVEGAVPRGVFSLSNSDRAAQQAVLDSPAVDGLSIRAGWATLEPSEGVFNWTFVDSEVARAAAAGKTVLLRIATQAGKPQWVTDAVAAAGGTFYSFDDNGVPTTIPVFWDPTFLAKKKAMIAALGAHFANNPTVKIVCASFANATSEDWNVPHTPEEVAKWLALGYTSEKMLDAGRQIIDATMMAFPNAYVTLAISGNGHVNGLNLDPDADYVARNAILAARSSWPGRLIVQKNSLSAISAIAPGTGTNFELLYNCQPEVGAQMLFFCFNDTSYRMNGGVPGNPSVVLHAAINNGLGYGMKFQEIYQLDCVNLPLEIAYAHTALLAQPEPTPTPSATPPAVPQGLRIVP